MLQKHSKQKYCPTHVSREDLAHVLGLVPTSVSRLAQQGILTKNELGFPLGSNIQRYAAHAAEAERRRASGSAAGTALAERKALAIEARLARADANLIETREALEVIDEVSKTFVSSLDRMVERGDLPPHAAGLLQDEKQRLREGAARIRARLISGEEEVHDDDV